MQGSRRLTAAKLRAAKPRAKLYRLHDGGGLSLEVHPNGSCFWRLSYTRPDTGRRTMASLGRYPDVPLAEARRTADELLEELEQGRGPLAAPGGGHAVRRPSTFGEVAEVWFAEQIAQCGARYRKKIEGLLRRYLLPALGQRPVGAIEPPEILAVARGLEALGKNETAHRLVRVTGQVIRYAMLLGSAKHDPTVALRSALKPLRHRHMPAPTDPRVVAELLRMIDDYPGQSVVAAAIRLLPLVFTRPGELRAMRWADVDLEAGQWRYTIPKTDTDHLVPLSRHARAILEALYPLTGQSPAGLVFPGPRTRTRPISDMTINAAYRRIGIDTRNELTGHGWRAVARTLLHEELGYEPDVIEHQLGHSVPDRLGRAYNRTRFLDERRRMMQDWADYLDLLKAGVPPKRAASEVRAARSSWLGEATAEPRALPVSGRSPPA